jgi:NitT/TauT family transport system permease protein
MDFNFNLKRTANASAWRVLPNRWDFVAFPLIICLIAMAAIGFHETLAPMSTLKTQAISLDPANLPEYAMRTTLRMLAAMVASLIFTLAYGTLAAKSRRAGLVLVPILDILQSVPVLGYISFTVTFFLALFPGRVLGAELAAIFAIFTSQAWNMTFSFYQSLRTVPRDLDEVSRGFHLTSWQRFWKLEVPFSMPGLIWNMMMSMSGGWFFVVASEAITVGNTTVTLPGIGSYVALAIQQKNLVAIAFAIFTMLLVIIVYDQLLFRPIVAWADKFRFEQTASGDPPSSWMLDLFRRTRALRSLGAPFSAVNRTFSNLRIDWPATTWHAPLRQGPPQRLIDALWLAVIIIGCFYAGWQIWQYLAASLRLSDIAIAVFYGLITLLRVVVLIALASLIWVPVGVWIGLRRKLAERVQPLAQFLAAFPANLAFPVFVVLIVRFGLDPNVWLSPLMILGTQWYILFNVIAGASAFPSDLKEAAASFHLRGWRWWVKVVLPGIFPYYITGAVTASGGSWNASIVAEVASWGNTHLTAAGLGAYIATATEAGDFPRVVLGIAVMCVLVTLFNRLLWRPLYAFGERRLRLG